MDSAWAKKKETMTAVVLARLEIKESRARGRVETRRGVSTGACGVTCDRRGALGSPLGGALLSQAAPRPSCPSLFSGAEHEGAGAAPLVLEGL